jgi:cell division protein FtsL
VRSSGSRKKYSPGGCAIQNVYVSLKRDTRYHRGVHTTLIVVLSLMVCVILSLVMRFSFDQRREELIESLRLERAVSARHESLRVELAGITRARAIELTARERLGLKRPKEEEVLVARHE